MTVSAAPSRAATLAAPVFSALLLGLAMPGLAGWWPLLFVALIPLLWAARSLPDVMRSGCMGMSFGLMYHISLLYWIVTVLEHYGGLHTVVAVAAILFLAGYIAAYAAFFCMILNRLTARPGHGLSVSVLLIAPAAWVGLDVVRGWLFTGMPWMDLGYGLYRQPLLVQAADLGGHHLITFFIVQINTFFYWLFDRVFGKARTSKQQYLLAAMACLTLYCAGGYSMVRWRQVESQAAAADQITAAAIQGNISQDEKWLPAIKEATVSRHIALSSAKAVQEGRRIDLVVWPETALPFYPHREQMLMSRVKDFTKEKQVCLLTGTPYFTINREDANSLRPIEYFNSAIVIDRAGMQTGRYNKQHLVPFGEYVPLRDFFWFIKPLVELVGDFTPGSSAKPLEAGNIKAGVLICFESIFPGIARRTTAAGANVLVSLTNDAWYGKSSAPHHSWAMTALRAVENRRSLVRAANTGISGFIAPTGAVIRESGLFTAEALTNMVPLMTEQTIFNQGGYLFGTVCLALTVCFLLQSIWAVRKRRREILRRKQELLCQQKNSSEIGGAAQ